MNLNPEQQRAVDARGLVFVSAGAGTGKTRVLVERFVRAVCDEGFDVDSILVITYTEKAAGELRSRIRAELVELGRHDLSRALDGAWVSTIHGFCHRLLRSHPFPAGVDPRFRVLDESQGRVLRSEAFEAALTGFCANDDPDRLRLLAVYGAARASAHAHGRLRDAPVGRARPRPRARRAAEPRCARCRAARRGSVPGRRRGRERRDARDGGASAAPARRGPQRRPPVRARRSPPARRAGGDVRGGKAGCRAGGARRARGRGPRPPPGAAPRLRRCVPGGQGPRVGSRFRGLAAPCPRSPARRCLDSRARAAPLPLDHGRRVPGHEPAAVRADRPPVGRAWRLRAVLRGGRVPVDLRFPARGRPGVPGAPRCGRRRRPPVDDELPLAAGGARGRQPPVRAGLRR